MGRDAHTHHTASDRQTVENSYLMTQSDQVLAGGQASRSGADDGNFLAGWRWIFLKGSSHQGFVPHIREFIPVLVCPVSNESLQPHDIDGFIDQSAAAGVFAFAVAHAPAD